MNPASLALLVCLAGFLPVTSADRPAAPILSFSAGYGTYLTGESVSLQCLPPRAVGARGYRFYKDGREVGRWPDPAGDKYRIQRVSAGSEGSYTCSYWLEASGQEIPSTESHPVSLLVVEPPATPTISLEPRNLVYIRGESITVRCEVYRAPRVLGYRFFKDGAEIGNGGTARITYMIPSVQGTSAGSYSCEYWTQEPGRQLTSMRSSAVSLHVTDHPPAPSISCHPSLPVYVTGEPVTLQCEAPSPATVTGYRFYQDTKEVTQGSGSAPGVFEVHGLRQDNQGAYSCIYWTRETGRDIPSLESMLVPLHVTGPLLPPILTLDPFDGRATDGDTVTLRCSLRIWHANLTAHFTTGNGDVLHSSSPNGTEAHVLFSFKVTFEADSGGKNYSCFYEADVRGRKLRSPQSVDVQVMVQARLILWPLIIGTVLGFLFTIVLALLLCWAPIRGRNAHLSQASKTPTPTPPKEVSGQKSLEKEAQKKKETEKGAKMASGSRAVLTGVESHPLGQRHW